VCQTNEVVYGLSVFKIGYDFGNMRAGEYAQQEKNRFYRIAKRSTTECAGILDVCYQLQLLEEPLFQEGRQLLLRIVAMLTKLARKNSDNA
jgi:four helix bundle protein